MPHLADAIDRSKESKIIERLEYFRFERLTVGLTAAVPKMMQIGKNNSRWTQWIFFRFRITNLAGINNQLICYQLKIPICYQLEILARVRKSLSPNIFICHVDHEHIMSR